MTRDRPADYLASLVRELCALPKETEWVEFKVNDAEPRAIGEYLSALANTAALVGKAFVTWRGACAMKTTPWWGPLSIPTRRGSATRSWRAGCCA